MPTLFERPEVLAARIYRPDHRQQMGGYKPDGEPLTDPQKRELLRLRRLSASSEGPAEESQTAVFVRGFGC